MSLSCCRPLFARAVLEEVDLLVADGSLVSTPLRYGQVTLPDHSAHLCAAKMLGALSGSVEKIGSDTAPILARQP